LDKHFRKKEIKEGMTTVRKKEEFENKGEGGTKILSIQPSEWTLPGQLGEYL
jgi:hypothetical protein